MLTCILCVHDLEDCSRLLEYVYFSSLQKSVYKFVDLSDCSADDAVFVVVVD